jgi:hypothetical protein
MKQLRLPRLASTALCFVSLALATASLVRAQTTFDLRSVSPTAANYATGSVASPPGGVFATGPAVFSHPSPTSTSVTFGQSFTVASNGTQAAGTGAWLYDGVITGATITAGTALPISYNFTLAKDVGITSDVTWSLYFRGGSNASVQVASGTLSAASATFSGSANDYIFASSDASDRTFRAYLGVAFTDNKGAASPPTITATMLDTGYGGQGITLNGSAVPEPSSYAAIAGVSALGLAFWRRRRAGSIQS